MTCREVSEFLMDYEAGELPADLLTQFERHLAGCANCQKFLHQYRLTIAAGRAAFDDLAADAETEVPGELVEAIVATLAREPS